MQVTDKLKEQMGSWISLMSPFIQSEEFDKIFAFLKSESSKKKVLIPKSADLFKSFAKCDKDKLKAIIVLMDPYPSFKDGQMIADGIPMSCANTGFLQPSLSQFYNAVEEVYGLDFDMDLRPDISYLLEEEGVMLINSSLSVEKDKVGSHALIWREFMNYFFKIINEYFKGLPIVLCGAAAFKYEKEINPLLHYIKKIEHPAAASYSNRNWNHENVFLWVNSILESNNGPEYKVNWIRKKGQKQTEEKWQAPKTGYEKTQDESLAEGLPWVTKINPF